MKGIGHHSPINLTYLNVRVEVYSVHRTTQSDSPVLYLSSVSPIPEAVEAELSDRRLR
jgi:hypothetical protein